MIYNKDLNLIFHLFKCLAYIIYTHVQEIENVK